MRTADAAVVGEPTSSGDGMGQGVGADQAGMLPPIPSSASSTETAAQPPGDGGGQQQLAAKAIGEEPSPSPTKRSAKGHRRLADKARGEVPDALRPITESRRGRSGTAASAAKVVMPSSAPNDSGEAGDSGLADGAIKGKPDSPSVDPDATFVFMSPLELSLHQLAELQVRRKFYISAVNKQTNAAKALARRAMGWSPDGEDREKLNGRAAKIVAAALAGKEQKDDDALVYEALQVDLAVVGLAIAPMQTARDDVEKQMKKLAKGLPVYGWAKAVHGFGDLGLAVLIAETGDLAKYPKKGHVWKRLGLGVHNEHAYSTWRRKGGLSADEWSAIGYSPRRRAEVYAVISEPLFRQQSVVAGPYRAIYDRRRERTAETHPDWTKGQSHLDGLRVMTKYLIRDLWVAWRRADNGLPEMAGAAEPAAIEFPQQPQQVEAAYA